ncbi:MAG: hypothetical protein VXW87_01430 [Pseudomonadota bacterium]|nr:hypothetical protein [Pseudomonadota bacterium]
MSIKNLWRKKGVHSCSFICQLVDNKSRVFFPDGYQQYDVVQAQRALPATNKMKKVDVFVVYFPSRWASGADAVYQEIAEGMKWDAVVMVIDISPDKIGQAMCRWGDELKASLNMIGVVDQTYYQGNETQLVGTNIMTGQFWGKQSDRVVSLESLVSY